jgi:hypothetical protein
MQCWGYKSPLNVGETPRFVKCHKNPRCCGGFPHFNRVENPLLPQKPLNRGLWGVYALGNIIDMGKKDSMWGLLSGN